MKNIDKDKIIECIKETMKEDYEKVLWIIKDTLKNRKGFFGLVFEYEKEIKADNVLSVIMFEKTENEISINLSFEKIKENKNLLKLKPNEKNKAEKILIALYKENKKVLLSNLFILDKVMMYYTHNKMFEEIKKELIKI
ncbi:hypothetical protein GRH50_07395 [Campylobacter lari]|nr:hypothetical protein [Campylobacter lari]EDP6895649.1 hypothetical protein [Campylobacter lari]MCV3481805.1 hypothetical protein [Campylobacter lari]